MSVRRWMAAGLWLLLAACGSDATGDADGIAPPAVGVGEGESLPELAFLDCEGAAVSLSRFRGIARALWIAVHTPVCRVCDSQNPFVEERYPDLLAQGVQLVVVVGPEDDASGPVGNAACAAYRDRVGPDVPVWQDPGTAETRALRARGYPTQIVTDADFVVRANDVGWDPSFDPGYYDRLLTELLR